MFGVWGLVALGVRCISVMCSGADYGSALTAGHFSFGKSNQNHLLLVWPRLRRGTFTPATLRGPAPNDIHVLTALSRHPCRLAHSAPPAFRLHPSRVLRCLEVRGMKIKSESRSSLLLCLCRRCRSVACPAIYRAAVAKSGDSVVPDTPHALDLLPVPGRSRDKPRSYSQKWSEGGGCTNQKAKSVSSRPETET
jgi:hypothetical protein